MLNKINISPDRQKRIVYLVLAIVTFAVFWQVTQYDFIGLDDQVYVTENSYIKSGITTDGFCWAFSTRYFHLWHPLIWLSFMFDYQLYGLNAGGYHLTNLILHIMSTLLLFWLFNRMTGAIWRSAFVAALFAIHPLHVESVAWIAERKDVLSTFFWMLTLCLYVYYTEKPVLRRYLPVLLCFACALMSKPMVITLPVVMILLDYWPLNRLRSQKIRTNFTEVALVSTWQERPETKSKEGASKENIFPSNHQKISEAKVAGIMPLWQLWEKTPFFILSTVLAAVILYAPYKSVIEQSSKLFSLSSRLANAPVAFVTYLEKTFWPHDLAVVYPFSDQLPAWQVLGAALLIIAISAAVIIAMKRLPYLLVGWLWYAITILPVIGIVQVGDCSMADHYTYIPLIGVFTMIAWLMPDLLHNKPHKKWILMILVYTTMALTVVVTTFQIQHWRDSFSLFQHALNVTKANYKAHHGLGMAYFNRGDVSKAIFHISESLKIQENNRARNDLGLVFMNQGRITEAELQFRQSIRTNPRNAQAHNNLGAALATQRKYSEAIVEFKKALEIDDSYKSAKDNLYRANNALSGEKVDQK
jgi:hypothetical protein